MRIVVEQAITGMILNEDIPKPGGGLLARKQQAITPELLILLKRSGVQFLNVDSNFAKQEKKPPYETSPSSYPIIKLLVRNDLMSVGIILEPAGPNPADASTRLIKEHLANNGIVSGIDDSAINNLVQSWNSSKKICRNESIAKGTPAQPGQEGSLEMKVRCIHDTSLISKIKSARYFWEIEKFLPQIDKVLPGTIIAQKEPGDAPLPGINVKGELLTIAEIKRTNTTYGDGVSLSDDGFTITATTQGIAYFCENSIGVLFVNFNGSIDVTISPDRMSASLIVHAASNGGTMPGADEIRSLLNSNRIISGINESTLNKLIQDIHNNVFPADPVLIAEGIPQKNGNDGQVEIHFNTETSLKPQQNPDGSVDYKNLNLITTVDQGQKLATLTPPTKGIPGKRVTGEKTVCQDGLPTKLPTGQNTQVSPEDPNELIASTDGIARYNGFEIDVSEGLIIPGDVNFSTGHVKYEKTVVISGDVKSGFDIECGGDLQVGGTIEDSHLTVGGNILCRYGFIGQGRGVINAAGDVNLSFLKNQTVKSKSCVSVAKEALNATIYAKRSITVHGKPLSIAGGFLTAGDSITLYSVGNHSGIKTTLEVGIDFSKVEELSNVLQQILEISNATSKLFETQKQYEKMLAKQFLPKEKLFLIKIIDSIAKYKQHLEKLEQHKVEISNNMHNFSTAFIKIEHSAMPGTLFKFGERHHLVKEQVIGPKHVRLIDHEIKIM